MAKKLEIVEDLDDSPEEVEVELEEIPSKKIENSEEIEDEVEEEIEDSGEDF